MEEKNESKAAERDLLRMFQRDVNMWPVFSREDEVAIARRARAGDQEATDLLIESNLRFVLKVVFQYWHPGLPVMDLISEGCLALVVASKTFDSDMGYRFITYAHSAIVHRVQDCIRLHYHHAHESLDDPIYDDGDETTYGDLLASDDSGADETVFSKQIRKMLADLDERERRILILRYWVDLTYKEIAIKLGHTPQWIRNVEAGALRKLRWARRADLGFSKEV